MSSRLHIPAVSSKIVMPTSAADPAAPVHIKRWRVRVIAVVLIVLAVVIGTSGVIVANKHTEPSVTAKQSLSHIVALMGDGVETVGGKPIAL